MNKAPYSTLEDEGRRSVEDVRKELAVLATIVEALAPLSKDERARVLRFVRDKFGIYSEA